ncbi:hypothetical protein ACHAQA_001499 [Verticillium albo-atrum]
MAGRIGETRVMTFGYAAGRHGHKLDLDIEDAALKLINDLERARPTAEQRNRPIVFIVHSLGGLVLKKALIISNEKLHLRHILWSVAGIIFLATPHRGSAMADVADKLLRFTNVTGAPQKFVKALKLRSPELSSIAEDFRLIVKQRRLPIASFYELHAFKAIPCLSTVIVPKDSAILQIPSERLFGAERDHRSIARFEDEHDEVFAQIVDRLDDFLKSGPVMSDTRVFIPWDTSSHFKGRRNVLQQLHETFLAGQDGGITTSRRRVAMIHGDGGLGKTELTLKYARENEFHYNYIFFAEATNVQTLRTEVINLHESLELTKDSGRELQDLRDFLRREESWLFILDNDNDFLALNHFRFPDIDHGHILITCRGRDNTTDTRLNKVIHLQPLDVKEARDLLFSRAGISTTERGELEDESRSLVDTLGCIPAMVENTAAYMVSFEADIQACLRLMNFRKSRRSVMGYHSSSARYKLSADSLFRIRLDSLIKQKPNAYLLLTSLVWLDRTKTTTSFFHRAVENRLRWAINGEPEHRSPQSSFVPEEFIDLISSPEFEIAIANLKSSSLIARDEVFDKSGAEKQSIVLHPSLYQFVRDSTSHDSVAKAICPALAMLIHAHPAWEGGLEKSAPLKRQMTYQVHQCLRNIDEVSADNFDLTKELQLHWGLRFNEFRETMSETLLEAIGNYADDDEMDIKLIKLIELLLKDSNSVYLRARLWAKRLPLEYYKPGKLYEGCAAAEAFLATLDTEDNRQGWTNRDNAEVGILRALTIEYRPAESELTDRQRWERRAEFINNWQPLDAENPSTLERSVVGLGVRMRGKLAKDFGQFLDAYFDLKKYCELYAERGSREEGWALGDFGQLVMELEDTEDGPAVEADLAAHGTNFGSEAVALSERARPCDLTAYVLSRAVDARMFERGYLTPEARTNARESDTMWLEMIHAMTVAHQGRREPERFNDAETLLLGLSERFRRVEAVESWYDEQIRHFSVKCCLAQVAHWREDWEEAQRRWADVVAYGSDSVVDWKGGHFYIDVARLSLGDAQCSGGLDPREVVPALASSVEAVSENRVAWMLGMGTFWLDFVMARLNPRIEALARLELGEDIEAQLEVMPAVVKEL